ncbi:ABC transporter ATP-binding protein [Bacillus thuringiensis serovar pingluonsis]|uniref:Carnitine transport ATP-binding protein OpuCA n=1 Tax=Bacillus thuringiensis serovar pingluonsis TaxID=180881 RepID=A0A2C9YNK2_BACTU|nr:MULTISPECIES: ABC transporter ATP-binding protein [Bacillus cereus group]CUB51628.1 Taurine import ATP-binding protein TauB [Bacillus subtilis]MDD8000209.1 ABC transporter ATP-binding protein [Bacillus cereus]MEB9681406.1 ABC transporter ATP-binding protein [Bacillus anthracis]MEC4695802.1 ABC transporter ATP-binding protein [Bacillus anthracis]OTY49372.1 ABC transporter ATP-binding protein [Bacillus thuringiensis serovar pingluonsis]
MRSKNILQFHNVSFHYDEKPIINELNASIQDKEFVSIIGPSGCGKSTLFRLITGLEEVSTGQIELTETKSHPVGYMPQKDMLLPWRTIIENAALPLECQGVQKKEAQIKAKELLQKFGLQGYETKYPKDLSGGMRQRVSFIRTLLTGGEILLLDEPFSALDALTKASLQEWLFEQWKEWEKTILFITHDVEEALFLSNRIFVVENQPITTLTERIVPLDRNRTRKDLYRPEVLALKDELLSMLQRQVLV